MPVKPASVSINCMTQGGVINVSQAPLQNAQASITMEYTEATAAPSFMLRFVVNDAQNQPICRSMSALNLPACSPVNCDNISISTPMVSVAIRDNLFAGYRPPVVAFTTKMVTAPAGLKVNAITFEIQDVKRIIKCPGQPDKTLQWTLMPLFSQHIGQSPATYQVLSYTSAKMIYPDGLDFSSTVTDNLWGAYFALPPTIEGCSEEFVFNLKGIIEFENGCTKEVTFNNLKVAR